MTVKTNNQDESAAPPTQTQQQAPAQAPAVPTPATEVAPPEKVEAETQQHTAAPPLADAGFPDKKPVASDAPPHPVFTRADETRMTELTQRETDSNEGQPLTPMEKEELRSLAARYQVFLDEGERALREGGNQPQTAGGSDQHATLRNVVTGTSNALIGAGKGAFFWGTLVATAVPGYFGKQLGLTERWDHWNWLSNKLILGALPVVTSVGKSGNHLEQLKVQLDKRKMKLGLVVACLEQEEMQGYGVGVLHFATADRWKEHLGLDNYEHVPMPDATAQVSYDSVKHAVDRMHQTMHAQNEVVYVHCKAGKGRSWMVVMCYLLTYGGMDWNTAKTTVSSGRHQVNPGQAQQVFAQEFARKSNLENSGSVPSSTTSAANTTVQ